ncbi:MAG: hypothetical protein HQK75_10510 [Candidatus Magnetomorum sp.]|nr:hypothetical protein [Candidatus Magnetomorum sp.]
MTTNKDHLCLQITPAYAKRIRLSIFKDQKNKKVTFLILYYYTRFMSSILVLLCRKVSLL